MEPSNDKIKIYLWPDGSWVSEEDIDDMDWYLTSTGKSDDYATYHVPIELDADDIEELIELKALPGMLPNKKDFLEGTLPIAPNDIIVINFPKDTLYTLLENKMIIGMTEGVSIEILKG